MIDWTDYIVPAPHAAVSPHTLCEVCANACGGCCWSEYGVQRPVPGWSAVRNDINIFGDRSSLKIESYAVLDCPPIFFGGSLQRGVSGIRAGIYPKEII